MNSYQKHLVKQHRHEWCRHEEHLCYAFVKTRTIELALDGTPLKSLAIWTAEGLSAIVQGENTSEGA